MGDDSVDPNPLGIATLPHGPLQVGLAWAWIGMCWLVGSPVSEVAWHLPFALIGMATSGIVFWTGVALQGRRAGGLAALLVAVLPLHAAFSRTSGESHFILAAALQQLALGCLWRGFEPDEWLVPNACQRPRRRRHVDRLWFSGLVAALLLTIFVHPRWGARRTLTAMRSHPSSIWLALPVLLGVLVHTYGIVRRTGIIGRVLSESTASHAQVGGLFLTSVANDLVLASNWPAVAVFALAAGSLLVVRHGTRAASVVLVLAFTYLAPFLLVIQRSDLHGHYIPISVALCLLVALRADSLVGSLRAAWLPLVGVGALALTLLVSAVSMVYGWTAPGGLVREGGARKHPARFRGQGGRLVVSNPYIARLRGFR